jgi:hypothetical protein
MSEFLANPNATAPRTGAAWNLLTAKMPSKTNRAITTSCATTNGASDCVGSIAFTAGLETRRLGPIHDSTQIWELGNSRISKD